MADKNKELQQRLLVTFRAEAGEYVKAMSDALLLLEKLPSGDARQQEIIETVFRQAHSLKGAARAVKFTQIEAVCQPMESVFSALRDRRMSFSTSLADLLHKAVNLIEALARQDPDAARELQPEVNGLVRELDRAAMRGRTRATDDRAARPASEPLAVLAQPPPGPAGPMAGAASRREVDKPAPMATVRIFSNKLDAVMRLSEEMLVCRLAAEQRAAEVRVAARDLGARKKRAGDMRDLLRSVERGLSSSRQARVEVRKLLGYLADEQVHLRVLEDQLALVCRSTERDHRVLTAMTEELQQRVRELLLLPSTTLLDMFARQARELAREQGKLVDVSIQGGEIEVDRRLLEEIKDPLIHLVRNCIDHGIEKPAQRQAAGKPAQGSIQISMARNDGGKITLTVADDGAGIDRRRLAATAVERGILSAEDAGMLSEEEALNLVFRSGLSTSSLITDVSGRGLGLAIVRDKVESLGGSMQLESSPAAGTRFRLSLPISLATFRGTLIRVSGRTFILPSVSVERIVRLAEDDIHHVNNCDTAGIGGKAMALVPLNAILGLPPKPVEAGDGVLAAVLGSGSERAAFRIDAVTDEQEVLVKSLGPQLLKVRNVAGASILGSGQVVPVLNIPDLLDAALRQPPAAPLQAPSQAASPIRQSILVAEDSITSRSLMKNILEASGFRVVTAVDGIDAFTTLKTQAFDLVISDVDMPRMNGFDLTARLRADAQLREIPVILVTALDSSADRERGVDAGANAYIVKSSFDQSNLLDVIERLL